MGGACARLRCRLPSSAAPPRHRGPCPCSPPAAPVQLHVAAGDAAAGKHAKLRVAVGADGVVHARGNREVTDEHVGGQACAGRGVNRVGAGRRRLGTAAAVVAVAVAVVTAPGPPRPHAAPARTPQCPSQGPSSPGVPSRLSVTTTSRPWRWRE